VAYNHPYRSFEDEEEDRSRARKGTLSKIIRPRAHPPESEELDVLSGALSRVRTRNEPQLVTLVGVPGIGKSRLVQELFQIIEQTPELIVWRQGRSLPYGEGVALWALGEMVKAQGS
jgi:predicted ATPase